MNIGNAIEELKLGNKVARSGWNGKGMFIILIQGTFNVDPSPNSPYYLNLPREQHLVDIGPHIDMYTAQGNFQPGWLASQADMLATDWELVPSASG